EALGMVVEVYFFFSSRRRHTRSKRDWSSDVCSSDLGRWESNPRPEKSNALPLQWVRSIVHSESTDPNPLKRYFPSAKHCRRTAMSIHCLFPSATPRRKEGIKGEKPLAEPS